MPTSEYLVWMDLEMTGLDPETCTILEIATIITDNFLNIVEVGPELVIHQPDSVLNAMDEWNTTHHGASGLLNRVRASTTTIEQAERETFACIRRYVSEARTAPLCGNSISQDRRFLRKYMPSLEAHLHYRNIDVSTIKELSYRWYPIGRGYQAPRKDSEHRALDDIRGSIEELRFYRDRLFVRG